ncbi:hypothetical protein [Rheinheimera maricola]|uniref:Uncharacterized protein n=1 Tax=Rheinheimera maricola TaxID=2793282 RepID=A0ABS7XA41_9GAMM|nr:hypothetical protein [Rheinheimera maricola]MBZ9612429.1 hypothetical protein [Rheinheimera maricola]
MAAKLAIFIIRSLISLLLGGAHLYFVILCFGYLSSINPLPAWLLTTSDWQKSALLILSVADLLLHILLAVPAVAALLYLQAQLRRYHLCLLTLPMLAVALNSLWQLFSSRQELHLSYLNYINTLVPAVALVLVGLLAIKHFGHLKARPASLSL